MEAYDLKDSGVEFLGKIPTHWRATKLKNIGHCVLGVTYKPEDTTQEEMGHLVLRSSNIQNGKLCLNDCVYIKKGIASPKQIVNIGDILICSRNGSRNLIGKNIKICESLQGETFGAFMTIFRSKFSSKYNDFIYYFFNSTVFDAQSGLYMSATINQLTTRTLSNFAIALPPIEEQKFITNYLNKACQNIDKTITLKQQQLLNISEQYKSKIVEVIRKGLNKDVELKDSHSEWLGKVPNHWKVKSIKRVTEIIRGKFSHRPRNDPAFYNGDYPFIQTGNVTNAQKYITSYSQTLNEKGYAVSKEFPAGTLTMTIAANIADVAILDFNACFPDSIVGFKPLHMVSVEYLYYMFIGLREDFLSTAILTTQLNLNIVRVGTIKCAIPPKDEQTEIVSYLNALTQNTETLKENIKSQIKTLTQYRQSLIHECVTGKKRIYQGETQ